MREMLGGAKSGPRWEFASGEARVGRGSWEHYKLPLEPVFQAAAGWKEKLRGISKPWLCWHLSDPWCLVQQRLVHAAGWTPVVGWDQNTSRQEPTLIPGAVRVNFNAELQLPVMFQMFPVEFAFLWADRLAFWHADLLLPVPKMCKYAALFESLKDGEMAAVKSYGGLRNFFRPRLHRYFEVLACTTKATSEELFRRGLGWWRRFDCHPNCPGEEERRLRARCPWDHGYGIIYWQRRYGGQVRSIRERDIDEGHFSEISKPGYKRFKNKAEEMEFNFDLEAIGRQLGIREFI